ncbi:MAG: pitrilysin family protein [Pseudomonadota bacterium]|nr:pitrilysin family protein [Pseudomonadota bacterium]
MKRILTLVLLASLAAPALSSPAWAKKPKKAPEAPVVVEPPPPAPDPEAWRATAPPAGPEGQWAPPTAKTFTLSNGVPVFLVENPGLPLVSVNVLMMVGREANPPGKGGLAALTANLLDEGTATRTGSQLAAETAMLGASLSVGQGDEVGFVSVDALTGPSLAPTLDLLADVALHPKFSDSEFKRVKAETLTSIQSQRAEPRDVVRRAFSAQLFGASHPYGLPTIGSDASVGAIQAGDVKKFYSTWWHAKNAAIVVAGAVTQADIQPLLEARFGTWKAGKATRANVPAPSALAKTRVVFLEQPGAVQSVVRLGTVGPNRTSPDFMAANTAGTLVAGMFSSRVNMNLREEHGWSYGAYGGFSETRDHGTFTVGTSVQADKTAPAVAELIKELSAAAGKVPADAELKTAKDYLVKSLAGNFETNSATATSFVAAPTYNLGADFWTKYPAQLNAVGPTEAAAMAKRYFDPSKQLIVVAGPRTIEMPGAEGAAPTKVDIVAELKALGYEFVDLGTGTPPVAAGK